MHPITRAQCQLIDREDPMAHCAARFQLPQATVYLDGNSLGPLPSKSENFISHVVRQQWGNDLIKSWNDAQWFDLPLTLGDRIGTLIGAAPGQIVVTDNTSVNLHKCIHAALRINPQRPRIVVHKGDFPTDLYVLQGVAASLERSLEIVEVDDVDDIASAIDSNTALVMLSHVNYLTAKVQQMEKLNQSAGKLGALTLWDLSHSAGALPVELDRTQADFAVGCTYKYLNGGPGAPAYVYCAQKHHQHLFQPLTGWWGHAAPFEFDPVYQSAAGIKGMLSGTQPILSMQGISTGLDTFDGVSLSDIRNKSQSLCDLFIRLVQQQCSEWNIELLGPRQMEQRGSHVSLVFEHGYSVVQAMIDKGVIGDFRAPNVMRFGFTPLYIGYSQIWDAVEAMRSALNASPWDNPKYNKHKTVT